MKETLVQHIAGSNMYGLATPSSDIDRRVVYVNHDPKVLFGFVKDESGMTVSDDLDVSSFELRKFFHLLRRTNTNILETLFCDDKYLESEDPRFRDIRNQRSEFIDSAQLLKSLTGYMHGEFNYVIGQRSGKLGGKRKEQLEKYGYSYKNLVHMKRLLYTAETFFETGEYVVSLDKHDDIRNELLEMKLHPENINLGQATAIGNYCLESVKKIKDTHGTEFNLDLACDLLSKIYL